MEHGILFSTDGDVLQTDIVDGHLWEAIELHSPTCTIADDILDEDITEDRRGLIDRCFRRIVRYDASSLHLRDRLTTVVHIERDGIGDDVHHRDVLNIDVLHDTATTTLRLKAQTYISAQKLAVGDHKVAHATTHLRAHDEATVTSKDRTAVDNDILTRSATFPSVGILTAFDADAIVAGIETGVDDEGVPARLEVEGITILGVRRVTREYIIYNNILTHQRMDVPGRGVLEDDPLQQHVLTADEADHHRTQETMDGLPLLIGLSCGHVEFSTLLTTGITL